MRLNYMKKILDVEVSKAGDNLSKKVIVKPTSTGDINLQYMKLK